MNERFGFRARVWLVFLLMMVGLAAVFILPPLRQPQGYHQFADRRAVFSIPNFLNVASNGPLLTVGLMGLRFLAQKHRRNEPGGFIASSERWAYVVFFFGVTLTGFGSACYHWRPSDSTLVWDRLPMTLTFMSMLAATITERIHAKLGVRLLAPLVVAGVACVFYWQWTGNLWPYAGVQFYSLFLMGLMIWLFPPRYRRTADLLWVIGIYALAKAAEACDQAILNTAMLLSGHTLKHLIAAVAVFWLLRMLSKRTPAAFAQSGSYPGLEKLL
jgi:hypothetical protein